MRRKVRRQTLRLILTTALEVLFTLGILAYGVYTLTQRMNSVTLVGVVALWVFLLVTWSFALWNRRGLWQPQAQTLHALVEFSYTRCLRQLRTVRFCVYFIIAEVLFIMPWGWWQFRSDPQASTHHLSTYLLIWGFTLVFLLGCLLWIVWYRRRARKELERLTPIWQSFQADEDVAIAHR